MGTMISFYLNGFMAFVVRITCLWLGSGQKLDITRGGSFYGAGAAGSHLPSWKGAVNPIEPPWGHRVGDAADRRRRERHHVGIAPEERNPAEVRRHLQNIPAQDCAASPGAVGPVKHAAAGKVAAEPEQCHTSRDFQLLAVPMADRGIGTHDPIGVGGVEVDGTSEGPGPILPS